MKKRCMVSSDTDFFIVFITFTHFTSTKEAIADNLRDSIKKVWRKLRNEKKHWKNSI